MQVTYIVLTLPPRSPREILFHIHFPYTVPTKCQHVIKVTMVLFHAMLTRQPASQICRVHTYPLKRLRADRLHWTFFDVAALCPDVEADRSSAQPGGVPLRALLPLPSPSRIVVAARYIPNIHSYQASDHHI